jgi:hypothetical protein
MIADFVTAMYEHPADAPEAIDLGVLEVSGESLTVGPRGAETEFNITAGHVGISLSPGDYKLARLLAYALEAWALFGESEVASIKARIAERGK